MISSLLTWIVIVATLGLLSWVWYALIVGHAKVWSWLKGKGWL